MKITMKTKICFLFIGLVATIAATNVVVNRFELPSAKVTIKVVDENERLLDNANVSLGFGEMAVEGMTDTSGSFVGEGHCGITGIGSTIKKDGYYMGYAPIPRFTEHDEALNRWQPWNETYIAIMRPIGKPVALYAKTVHTQIPALDQPCGYDLEAGDWVSPYGKGMKKDFIFTIHQEWRGNYDYDVQGELTFKNSLDGLLETSIPNVGKNSEFRWEREASG